VGGLYKDQGLDVVREWVTLLFKSRVEAAYQVVRGEYLLPPVTGATTQSVQPATSHPLPPSPHSAGHTSPSGRAEDPAQSSRRAQLPANQSQKGTGQARGSVCTHSEPGNDRWGRRASSIGGGLHDASEQGRLHQEGCHSNSC
jgi:hypothetical protein